MKITLMTALRLVGQVVDGQFAVSSNLRAGVAKVDITPAGLGGAVFDDVTVVSSDRIQSSHGRGAAGETPGFDAEALQ